MTFDEIQVDDDEEMWKLMEELLAKLPAWPQWHGLMNHSGIVGRSPLADGSISTVDTSFLDQNQFMRSFMEGFNKVAKPAMLADAQAHQAGVVMERERILALMRELRPLDSAYTRRDWAIEQKAQKELLDKLIAAVESGRAAKKAGD